MMLPEARSRRPVAPSGSAGVDPAAPASADPAPADPASVATASAGTASAATAGIPAEGVITDTGRGVRVTWWFTVSSIVFYSAVISATTTLFMLADGEYGFQVLDGAVVVLSVIATVALIRYCWFFRPGLGGGPPAPAYTSWLVLPAAALYVVGVLQPHTLWIGALPLWLAVNAVIVVVPRTQRIRILVAGVVVTALHGMLGLLLGLPVGGTFWEEAGVTVFVAYILMTPMLFVAGIWWWDIVVRLDDSRRTSGELAVARERLRFAADLHDIQGHHLQVIALKTELAGRLLGTDPAAARVQIAEAQDLARTALEDTRALVHGYRAVSLAVEATNAAEVLGAAGIECSVDVRAEGLPPDGRTLFGLVIREATTNILRHSEATSVELVLLRAAGRFDLTVRNDGVASVEGSRTGGSGIDGLRHRFEAVGGMVRATREGAYFTLTASAPDGADGADGGIDDDGGVDGIVGREGTGASTKRMEPIPAAAGARTHGGSG